MPPTTLRPADEDDLLGLLDLERAATMVGLAHVFPSERFPYPDVDVLARWRLVLDEPGCTTLVLDGPDRLDALLTVDGTSVRHVAVHPDRWGEGLGTFLLRTAAAGAGGPLTLWCLVANTRARGLYERLGWRPTGVRRDSVFPPYPEEMEYSLAVVGG